MAHIFISYSRQDKGFARRLATDLDRSGGDAWIDLEDIHPADDWADSIQGALDECQLLIVIVSPVSMASKNVADEWKYFKSQGKPILPVLWKPAKVHYQLHSLQYVDFHTQDYDTAFAQLHSELRRQGMALAPLVPGNTLVPLPAQTPLPVRPQDLSRQAMLTSGLVVAGFVLAAVLSLLGVFDSGDNKPKPTATTAPITAVNTPEPTITVTPTVEPGATDTPGLTQTPASTLTPAGASNNAWTPVVCDFSEIPPGADAS
jgi:hypothetical protein